MTITDNFWQNLLLGVAAGAALLLFSAVAFAADVPRLDVVNACRAAAGADIGVVEQAEEDGRPAEGRRNELQVVAGGRCVDRAAAEEETAEEVLPVAGLFRQGPGSRSSTAL